MQNNHVAKNTTAVGMSKSINKGQLGMKGIIAINTILLLTSAALLPTSAGADMPIRLVDSELDSISAGGTQVQVSVGASGSGATSGSTQVVIATVGGDGYPFSISSGGGGAIACCGFVSTHASVATGVSGSPALSFQGGVVGTVSALGFSLSFATGTAISVF